MLRLIIQTKRKYKKKVEKSNEEKRQTMRRTNDEKAEDRDDCCKNSEGETEEGNSSKTDCDKESEVSFVGDTDEDMKSIREKKHETSRRKDEDSQYPLLDYDTQKDEMDIGNEDRFPARDEMVKKKKEQNGVQASAVASKQAEQWEDQERDGKTTSINSSSLRKQTTTHGYG